MSDTGDTILCERCHKQPVMPGTRLCYRCAEGLDMLGEPESVDEDHTGGPGEGD